MSTPSAKAQIDLIALAASLSHQDGDGHRWSEEEARQWLNRMGIVSPSDSAEEEAKRLRSAAGNVEEI